MENSGIEVIKAEVKLMPNQPGIYKMISQTNEILYIGKAKNLPKRVISYTKIQDLPYRLQRMVSNVARVEYLTTQNEAEALLLEANLIKTLKPRYNIALKDDKSFPYIVIEKDHPFPRVAKFRGKKKEKNTYFGPFGNVKDVNQTLVELQKIFLVRPCTNAYFANRSRPCLQYQIKRCSAPCVNKVSVTSYQKQIEQIEDFLNGRNSRIQEEISKEMWEASNNQDYERAAVLRDRIRLLSQIQAKNTFKTDNINDADLIAIYKNDFGCAIQMIFIRSGNNYGGKVYFPSINNDNSESEILSLFMGNIYQKNQPPTCILLNINITDKAILEKALSKIAGYKVKVISSSSPSTINYVEFATQNAKEALEKKVRLSTKNRDILNQVSQLFKINKIIQRIEVYDNSHIQGIDAVGCMIVAGEEGFIKNDYRKFNIKSISEGDDYAMLKQVLVRRLSKLGKNSAIPDLLLIDGGKGHLSTALSVLEELNLTETPVVCISKGVDRNSGREFFHMKDRKPFQIEKGNPVLHYLQYIRDEVHRFAIETHRKKRAKGIKKSKLDDIPEIGDKRKKLLLSHFGSFEMIKNASIQDLQRVKGISRNIASSIFSYLHKDE